MKKATLICLILLSVCQLYAQPQWQWGKRGGSGATGTGAYADERIIDMATDRNGNVYVLAVNNPGLANVDGRTGIGVRDRLTIASWSCDGRFRWMKNYGGASTTIGRALAVDSLDGVYVTGQTFSNNALAYTYLDVDTNLGNTNKRLFIVKYDTSGALKWLKMPQPDTATITSVSRPLDLVAAPNGDIFWYGFFGPGNYNNNGFVITTPGYYIIRFSATGTYQATIKLDMITTGGGNAGNADGITIAEMSHFSRDHNNGRFYLTGQYIQDYGTISFGNTSVNSTGAIGALPIYVAAFNSNGNSLWIKQSSGSLYASTRYCRAVVDPQGNVYIGGDIYNGNTFGGHTFTNNLSIHNFPFVLSLDMTGNLRWATSGLPRDGGVAAYNIAYSQNTIGLAGYYGGLLKWGTDSITAPLTMSGTAYILLTRHDAATGAVMGMDSIASQSSLYNFGTAITGDNRGNFFVGGSFDYRLFPARDTIAVVGGTYDWFVAKFGTAQCGCTNPIANFAASSNGATVNFTYTGTSPYSSVSWNFGDNTALSSNPNPTHNYASPGSYNVCVTVTNSCGSHQYCKTISISNVGIQASLLGSDLVLYPNPASDFIILNATDTNTPFQIYDVTGREMLHGVINRNPTGINISKLSAGWYVLAYVTKDGSRHTRRFIKK